MIAETAFAVPMAAPQATRWRPRLVAGAAFGEVFGASDESASAAAALALALDGLDAAAATDAAAAIDGRPWLWVQDAAARRLTGRPYRPGLPARLRHRLVHVAARNAEDALFALEEGLRCRDLAFVMGEIAGNPKALSFTATRRLSLAVERHGVPLWLVRLDAARDLGAARLRWQVRAAPSPPMRWNPQAPGSPTWHAELFRARAHPPGEWTLWEDGGLHAQPTGSGGPARDARRA